MSSTVYIHITSAPTPNCEALEYALAMAAFDLDVSILFSQSGLAWVRSDQTNLYTGIKNPHKMIKALPVYGITQVYYCTDQAEPLIAGFTQPLKHISDWEGHQQAVVF